MNEYFAIKIKAMTGKNTEIEVARKKINHFNCNTELRANRKQCLKPWNELDKEPRRRLAAKMQ